MTTITLKYDGQNSNIKGILEGLINIGVFIVEKPAKEEYNKEFVEKIKRSKSSKGKTIKTIDLWK